MDDKEQRGYLKDEYVLLQNQYEGFDGRALTIKGWVAGGTVPALVLAYGTSADKYAVAICWSIITVALAFWYLDARWKMFQYALRERIIQIEAHFRQADSQAPAPLQVYTSFFGAYQRGGAPGRFLKAAMQDFVLLPYAAIIALALMALHLPR